MRVLVMKISKGTRWRCYLGKKDNLSIKKEKLIASLQEKLPQICSFAKSQKKEKDDRDRRDTERDALAKKLYKIRPPADVSFRTLREELEEKVTPAARRIEERRLLLPSRKRERNERPISVYHCITERRHFGPRGTRK